MIQTSTVPAHEMMREKQSLVSSVVESERVNVSHHVVFEGSLVNHYVYVGKSNEHFCIGEARESDFLHEVNDRHFPSDGEAKVTETQTSFPVPEEGYLFGEAVKERADGEIESDREVVVNGFGEMIDVDCQNERNCDGAESGTVSLRVNDHDHGRDEGLGCAC